VTIQLDPDWCVDLVETAGTTTITLHRSLRSVIEEFIDPLRTNDSLADFYAVYSKKSGEFDRSYVKKHDDDLNTSLIFVSCLIFVLRAENTKHRGMQAGLFSAVSSAFITNIQSKLEPDPNEMTATYMQYLVHNVNNSLFPTVDPNSATWTGPPPEIVTVQSILYASLATSLLAAFLAMLGKQWINRYLRSRGGSVAKKSRRRQRKLDGLKHWRFYLVIEIIPAMLQLALLLLGGALAVYLWKISRTVAQVILAFTLFGAALHVLFSLAATFYRNCPYQTPPSIIIRALVRFLSRNDFSFSRSVKFLMAFLVGNPRRAPVDMEHAQPAVVEPSTWNFGEIPKDLEDCKGDVRCISWMLNSATDSDIIFCTARFAADAILYPEIADILSPRVLADHFNECQSDGRVIPGRLEHANVIGMALASVLSIQLCAEPESGDLRGLSDNIHGYANSVSESEKTFFPGVGILRIVSQAPEFVRSGSFQKWDIFSKISDDLPATDKLCLSRTVLQTVWRWRRIQRPSTTVFDLGAIDLFCKGLMANGGHIIYALKTNCFLIMAISLGHRVGDICTLFVLNDECVISPLIPLTSLIKW